MKAEDRIILNRIRDEVGNLRVALVWFVYQDSEQVNHFGKVCVKLNDESQFEEAITSARQSNGFRFFVSSRRKTLGKHG